MAVREWPCLLRAHAAVVAALLLLFGVLFALDPPGGGGGANIGLGLAGLPLLGLGLPWSWLVTAVLDAREPFLLVAGAPLNVVLHAALQRWWRTRQKSAP